MKCEEIFHRPIMQGYDSVWQKAYDRDGYPVPVIYEKLDVLIDMSWYSRSLALLNRRVLMSVIDRYCINNQ